VVKRANYRQIYVLCRTNGEGETTKKRRKGWKAGRPRGRSRVVPGEIEKKKVV